MSKCSLKTAGLIGAVAFVLAGCDRAPNDHQEFDLSEAEGIDSQVVELSDDRPAPESQLDEKAITILDIHDDPVKPNETVERLEPEDNDFDTIDGPESERDDIVVGDAVVPLEWFENASEHVRSQITGWAFTLKRVNGKNLLGVVDENGHFVTWPGAKVFADGEYPEGYIFIGFEDQKEGTEKPDAVRF